MAADPRERTYQRTGAAEVAAALDAGERLGRVLVARDAEAGDTEVARVVARARSLGVPVEAASAGDLRRLSLGPPAPILALANRDPSASPEAVMALPGAKWLLVGAAYPGNVGAALRTVEVSGAAAAFVDAELDRAGRRAALRTSMHAERFLPVFWEGSVRALARARDSGHRIVGIEDVGDRAPWEVDLVAPTLFVVGGEDRSLARAQLDACDAVVRLPMAGFIPCYNLQAAVAVVALERLRQAAATAGPRPA
ncbi:MAG TPA: TrmH family RNA methyltransferase [Myxococcota bacterium]|nr:TrmH family RNA methyltransferase [Myxococcota bacterium]